jgi:hypothetical protein
MEDLSKAAETSQDQYDAWKDALSETIRSLIINSQDLDKDVTSVVRKAQTELLGFTQAGRRGGDQFSAMQQNLDALGLAQDVFFGDEKEQLSYSEMLREDRINGMNESAAAAISALETQRTVLENLMDKEREEIALINETTKAIKEKEKAIEDLQIKEGEATTPTIVETPGIKKTPTVLATTPTPPTPTYPYPNITPYTGGYNITRQPQGTQPNALVQMMKGGNALVQIIVNGVNKNQTELAQEVKRQIMSLG